jgi:hypothetical protein
MSLAASALQGARKQHQRLVPKSLQLEVLEYVTLQAPDSDWSSFNSIAELVTYLQDLNEQSGRPAQDPEGVASI